MTKLRKKTYHLTIPAQILSDPRLSPVDKLVLTEIISLTRYRPYCFASNAHFVERLGVSRPTITRSISDMVGKKILLIPDEQEKTETGSRRQIYPRYALNDDTLKLYPQSPAWMEARQARSMAEVRKILLGGLITLIRGGLIILYRGLIKLITVYKYAEPLKYLRIDLERNTLTPFGCSASQPFDSFNLFFVSVLLRFCP